MKDFCWHRYSRKGHCKCEKADNCSIRLQHLLEGEDYIYIGAPKCGSTSITHTIGNHKEKKFKPVSDIVEMDKFKFTFVRNPWSRVLSCWLGWIKKRPKSRLTKIDGISARMSFKNFVEAIQHISNVDADQHFVSLSYLTTYNGENFVDFIGKVENINDDWDILVKKLGFDKIKHLANSGIGAKILRHYDDNMINIIGDRYKDDIVAFDYKIDDLL